MFFCEYELSCFLNSHVHGEVEEFWVPVFHPALGEQHEDELPAGHLSGHDHRLVLDVGGQALGVHLQCHAHLGWLSGGRGRGGSRWGGQVGYFGHL